LQFNKLGILDLEQFFLFDVHFCAVCQVDLTCNIISLLESPSKISTLSPRILPAVTFLILRFRSVLQNLVTAYASYKAFRATTIIDSFVVLKQNGSSIHSRL
jgi:hypothetical protein